MRGIVGALAFSSATCRVTPSHITRRHEMMDRGGPDGSGFWTYLARRGIRQFLPTPRHADFAMDVFPGAGRRRRGFVTTSPSSIWALQKTTIKHSEWLATKLEK